jgi:hypothetical protein
LFCTISRIAPSAKWITRSAIAAWLAAWVTISTVVPSRSFTSLPAPAAPRARGAVERAGGLVAEQRPSGCLATARAMATRCCSPPDKLRREMIGAVAQAHQRQRLVGSIGSAAISVTSSTFSCAVRLGIRL